MSSLKMSLALDADSITSKVIIALAKNAGSLQNGLHMLLLTWTYLVSCLFCKRGKKRE